MGKIFCFLYARTEYEFLPNLDYCNNDINELYNAINKFLNVPSECIGKHTNLSNSEYMKQLDKFINSISEDDTCIFYHTSHGCIYDNELILCNNESSDNNQDGIFISKYFDKLKNLKSKKNIIFLDCCHSGNAVDNTTFLFNENIKDKIGIGTTVITSCQDMQSSYLYNPYDDSSESEYLVSAFTKFICYALRAHYIRGTEEIFFYDLYSLILVYSNIWSLKNKLEQKPNYITNSFGTLWVSANGESYDENNEVEVALGKPYRIYNVENVGIKKINNSFASAIEAKILIDDNNDNDLGDFLETISIQLIKLYSEHFSEYGKNFIVFLYISTDIAKLEDHIFKYRSIYLTQKDQRWYNSLGKCIKYHNNLAYTFQGWTYTKDMRELNVEDDEYFIDYWNKLMPKLLNVGDKCSECIKKYSNNEITFEQLKIIFKTEFPIIRNEYINASDRKFTLPYSIVKGYNDKAYQYLLSLDNLLMAFEVESSPKQAISYIKMCNKKSIRDFDKFNCERNKLIKLGLIHE